MRPARRVRGRAERQVMNLDESLQRLFHRNLHLIKLDLEPMKALMDLLGHPQNAYVCVHIAGTNGKGSVCAMLDSILRQQGYRTGLYTSPHLIRFNERIQVDGRAIDDDTLKQLIDELETAAAKLAALGHRDVTFFEFTTALAFLHFKRAGVQIAVIETGMGGRLDATNVVIPAVSVITSIGLEHQQYLGETIALIAGEKAGIIKPGRPVITGVLPEDAETVIARRAASNGCLMIRAADAVAATVTAMTMEGQKLNITSENTNYGTIHMRLTGQHQAVNAAVAVAAAECLDRVVGVPVSEDAIKQGLTSATWPARGQMLSMDPPVILDGGHNPEAAAMMAAWMKKIGGKRPLGMVVGFLADKDPSAFMREFSRLVQRVWIVPINSDRAMPASEIAVRLSFLKNVTVADSIASALHEAARWAKQEDGIVLATGSLYLAGAILAGQSQS